jgi:thymidylate kinase
MLFLDASPNVLLERIRQRKETEMFETRDALVEVRKKALKLAKKWYIIDTEASIEQTYGRIEKILDELDSK